jgi:hypothetical protein
MPNRPAILTFMLAIVLVGASTGLLLSRSSVQSSPADEQWRITLLDDGRPAGSSIQREVPRDPASLFPQRPPGGAVSYRLERIAAPNPPPDGWCMHNHQGAEDRRLIEFLLLLPPATLLICFFRNVIGLSSFGTFAPALLGLAFREVHSLIGVFLVLTIITAGWWLRRGLNELHLLQVPRTALLLSCVVVMILLLLHVTGKAGAGAITLFPLVILTGMIERFWTMEEEDGAAQSIGTLASTLFMAACVWLMAAVHGVAAWLLAHPESIGFVMAVQLLLGRYTGFRLVELYRFRTLIGNGGATIPKRLQYSKIDEPSGISLARGRHAGL